MYTEYKVAIVRHVSECDVEILPGTEPMSYRDALEALRNLYRKNPRRVRDYSLCSVTDDGQLGRYVSYVL